ncbi:MAG TPA: sodium:solute symporter [Candidatus Rifleibacterium sp.]|nr:sodium:solute symporter [Candidatus Rifleibacterium sp.]HPT46061.1 sodium:solute symporter [Candidatus Rifleibacterium sp.]
MSHSTLVWSALILYVVITFALTIRGMRRTKDLASFAVGNKDIGPFWVGLSLTAQLTSVATFVVNPGLVYHYGFSALLGLGFAAGLGIMIGLCVLSGPFMAVGDRVKALTIPQWIGACYESKGLRLFFAVISLTLVSFIVLIAVAIALTLFSLLQMTDLNSTTWLVVGVMAFVFSYTLLGGANTSTYTNAIQALVMLLVAVILILSGYEHFMSGEGLFAKLAAIDPGLTAFANPASLYFRNFFEVFFCNFLVGLAIVCQPHILGKVFLLKDRGQIKTYLATAIIAGAVFVSVMLVGLYARVTLPQLTAIDRVVPTYIAMNFGSATQVLISIGLLCAGISTLEGLLLALSAIFSSDIYLTLKPISSPENRDAELKTALMFGKIALVIVGIGCIGLSIWQLNNPTGGSVAIFAQYGVYLLFTATFLPIACGLFLPAVTRELITVGVGASTVFYFLPAIIHKFAPTLPLISMANNPAILATSGIIAGWLVIIVGLLIGKKQVAAGEVVAA